MNKERDVIGEVIAEDNARPIHPAVAEYAVAALHTATSDGERVAELELLSKELWRQNEAQAREIERLKAHGAKWLKRAENWSELKAQPSGVVLPERAELDRMWREIQDSAMRSQESPHIRFAEQLARLNSSPLSAGDDRAECVVDGLSVGMSQGEADEFADKVAVSAVPVPRELLEQAVTDAESWYALHGEPERGDYYAAHVDIAALLAKGVQS